MIIKVMETVRIQKVRNQNQLVIAVAVVNELFLQKKMLDLQKNQLSNHKS